ncbi:DUF6252 family protein [Mesonia sediminis]|uniref:DUF6252 family protein n=1 Tax=Mesonia sediminis TaxID=1703946 RepID=A0ABW5SFI4_9FLAO
MKKFFLLNLMALFLVSCGDDVESNAPSIQGELEGVFFRTSTSYADVATDNSLQIVGNTADETITLNTENFKVGNYLITPEGRNSASFMTFDGEFFTTSEANGEGMISITRSENGSVSGEFYFNAISEIDGDTLNFSKGYFFEVPFTSVGGGEQPGPEPSLTCEEAQTTSNQSRVLFENTNPNNPNYSAICQQYAVALEQEKAACGDEDGSIQDKIDALPCSAQ